MCVRTVGEEDETHVMQMQCKLYVFNGETSSWLERGLGVLRLNDSKEMLDDDDDEDDEGVGQRPARSRLIFRAGGTHRLALNTPVWAGLKPELVSATSGSSGAGRMRLLARTDEGLAVYIVVGKQLADLHELLVRRVRWAQANEAASKSASASAPPPPLAASASSSADAAPAPAGEEQPQLPHVPEQPASVPSPPSQAAAADTDADNDSVGAAAPSANVSESQ